MLMMHEWGEGDFSQYNHAKKPWYSISGNGKVDIGKEYGDDDKIGLTTTGMFVLVKDWLSNTNSHEIKADQRKELIELLSKK
jgi:hypothetical protein